MTTTPATARAHERIVATYERANRIFSGMAIECQVTESDEEFDLDTSTFVDGPVAWSIGSEIFFSRRVVEDAHTTRSAEVALAGLNFHELGHALYTPPPDSWLRGHLADWKGLAPAFNALEDQRVESLLTAQFPSLASYFVEAFQSFVVANTDAVYTSHLLAHGRRFLPAPLRQVLSAEFVGTWEERDEAEDIIDEYRTLVLGVEQTDAAERAIHLVSRFSALIAKLGESIPSRLHGPRFGGAVATLAQVDAQQARELLEKGHDFVRIKGSQFGSRQRRPSRPKRTARRRIPRPVMSIGANPTVRSAPVPAEYVAIARRFRIELQRLRGDADAGWIRQQPTGRLNAQRVMLGADPEVAFDRWQEASFDAADIDAVLLLDASGSMYYSMTEVCAAAWAIKRAVEDVGGKVTVVSYDDNAGLVYAASERAGSSAMRVIRAHGGNEPLTALQSARHLLSGSRAVHRILVTLADGDWGNNEVDAHAEVDALRATGVTTAIGLLGTDVSDDPHQHEHVVRLTSPSALITMAKAVVWRAAANSRTDPNGPR